MMGVEVISTGAPFERVFDEFHATPALRQAVKSCSVADPATPTRYLACMSEHPSIAKFRAALAERGGTGRIVVLPDSVHTAALAAEALGCEVGAIANSLLFAASTGAGEDEPVLILTSGGHRVDTDKAAAAVGVDRLKRAKPEFVREHTGQVIGGVSPIAHPAPIRTFLDPTLRQYDEVWAAAGHPAAVFSTTYDELRTMTDATEIEVN
jgi:prolyl-tRNA editing enzyme YbaK/EbsC (Cys-tRNA(Pro) deacylase)